MCSMDKNLADKFSDNYLTISQYAREIGVSRQAVHKAIVDGRLVAKRIGYTWFIRKER